MKCPKCKKNLKTKRTFGAVGTCRRERFCPKCKEKLWTIEFLQRDHIKERQDSRNALYKEESKRKIIEERYCEICEVLEKAVNFAGGKG